MTGVMPNMSNITGYFDMTTLDVANRKKKNAITGGNDITLIGGTVENEALKLGSGEYGDYICTEPDTIYILIQKPTADADMCMIAKGKNGGTKTGFGLWHGSYGFRFSATGSPYIDSIGVSANYHVITIARITDTDTSGTDAAMLFVDGVLYGFLNGLNKGYYTGSITINRYYNGSSYTGQGSNPMYVKAIAIGGIQSVEEIIENSNFLLNSVLPEKGDGEMAGADAAAIAWCMATTLQQAKSFQEQLTAYRKGIVDGDEEGTTNEIIDDEGSTDIETPYDGENLSEEDSEKIAERGASAYYTVKDSETDEIYYLYVYTTDESGIGRSEMGSYEYAWNRALVYDVYDANGNVIVEKQGTTTYYSNGVVPSNVWYFKTIFIVSGYENFYGGYMYVEKVEVTGRWIIVHYVRLFPNDEIRRGTESREISVIPGNATVVRTTSEKPF